MIGALATGSAEVVMAAGSAAAVVSMVADLGMLSGYLKLFYIAFAAGGLFSSPVEPPLQSFYPILNFLYFIFRIIK